MTRTEVRPVSATDRPRMARHVRLSFCKVRQRPILLLPETVVVLNASGADILHRCDGQRTVAEIVDALSQRYRNIPDGEVSRFLAEFVARRWIDLIQKEVDDDRTQG